MTGTALLTVAVLAAHAAAPTQRDVAPASPFARALDGDSIEVRGQSPMFTGPVLGSPEPVTTYYQTPTYNQSVAPSYVDPNYGGVPGYSDPTFGQSVPGGTMPYTSDPWLGGGAAPYGYGGYPGTTPGTYNIGLNGPQPYQFGFTHRYDVGWIVPAGTNLPGGGDLGVFETNLEKELTVPTFGNWIFTVGGQYNLRLYDGPEAAPLMLGDAYPVPGGTLPASAELPGAVHRIGLNLRLRTPQMGMWTFEGGFNPALATDFDSTIKDNAVLYDAHAVAFLQLNPRFMVALGAQYWDRVDNMIVPYAGVVWNPNDILEFRLLFPKPRISMFIGTPFGLPTWAYVQGEYHVEAYGIGIDGHSAIDTNGDGFVSAGEQRALGSRRVQLEDWRVVGGLYTEGPSWTSFIEAGAVLDRP
ncbi:MAG: hypothetical protein KDA75_03460, partial [Planctomycetaceae bacterium]|nr:hypothetical protein [Planctomycetaceae bacterium]